MLRMPLPASSQHLPDPIGNCPGVLGAGGNTAHTTNTGVSGNIGLIQRDRLHRACCRTGSAGITVIVCQRRNTGATLLASVVRVSRNCYVLKRILFFDLCGSLSAEGLRLLQILCIRPTGGNAADDGMLRNKRSRRGRHETSFPQGIRQFQQGIPIISMDSKSPRFLFTLSTML